MMVRDHSNLGSYTWNIIGITSALSMNRVVIVSASH